MHFWPKDVSLHFDNFLHFRIFLFQDEITFFFTIFRHRSHILKLKVLEVCLVFFLCFFMASGFMKYCILVVLIEFMSTLHCNFYCYCQSQTFLLSSYNNFFLDTTQSTTICPSTAWPWLWPASVQLNRK